MRLAEVRRLPVRQAILLLVLLLLLLLLSLLVLLLPLACVKRGTSQS